MQAVNRGVELVVHLYLVAVKFQFRRIKQGFVARKSRHDFVHRLYEIDDVRHRAVRHSRRDVARNRVFQRGTDVGHSEFLLPGAFARENIPVTLHEDFARAQHIRELPYFLRVFYRLVEGLVEGMRAKYGEVGVFAFQFLIAVTVDDREVVVVVFLRHETAGVLAENADFVFERCGVSYEFRLIEHAVDLFHNLVAHFHPDSDVHDAGGVGDVVLRAHLFQPVRSAAAGGDDCLVRAQFPHSVLSVLDNHALADVVFQDYVVALRAEYHFHAVVAQIIFYGEIYALRLFGAHMTDGAIHEFEPRFNRFFADFLDLVLVAEPFYVLVRAEFEINLVGIVDEFLREIVPYEFGKLAAHFVRKRQFAVRKRARTRKSRRNVAVRLAVAARSAVSLGTLPLFDGLSFFDDDHFLVASAAQKFNRRKNARRTRSDYADVILFHKLPPAAAPSRAQPCAL